MFITDGRCSVPLHILMADLVESQGGSALLHKVLNRVGICASADTLARFVQHKLTVLQGMENMYINKEHFTVVSADNVEFMHTYARVVKGKQNSSWHGTTVQAVQPLPSHSLCSRLDGQSAPPHRGTGAVLEHETTRFAPSCETGAPFGPTHPLSAHTQSAPPHRGTGAVLEHETSEFAPSGETGAPFGSACPLSAHTQSAPPHRGTEQCLSMRRLSLLRLVRLEPLLGLNTHSQLTQLVPHCTEAPEQCLSMKPVGLLRLVRLEPLLGLHTHSQLTYSVPHPTEAPERCLSMRPVSLLRLVRLEPLLGLLAHS